MHLSANLSGGSLAPGVDARQPPRPTAVRPDGGGPESSPALMMRT